MPSFRKLSPAEVNAIRPRPWVKGPRRREEIYQAMLAYQKEHGRPATITELAATVGYKSTNTSWFHLQALVREGRVQPGGKRSSKRAYVALPPPSPSLDPRYAGDWPLAAWATRAYTEPGRIVWEYDS